MTSIQNQIRSSLTRQKLKINVQTAMAKRRIDQRVNELNVPSYRLGKFPPVTMDVRVKMLTESLDLLGYQAVETSKVIEGFVEDWRR